MNNNLTKTAKATEGSPQFAAVEVSTDEIALEVGRHAKGRRF